MNSGRETQYELTKPSMSDQSHHTSEYSSHITNKPDTMVGYDDFINAGIPSEVQLELKDTIRRELRVSEDEEKKIMDIYFRVHQRSLRSFQHSRANLLSDHVDNTAFSFNGPEYSEDLLRHIPDSSTNLTQGTVGSETDNTEGIIGFNL